MIHIETEVLRETGSKVAYQAEAMWDQTHTVYQLAGQLDMHWSGSTAAEGMVYQLRELTRRLNQNIVEMDRLAYYLIAQANAWEENDQAWAARYRVTGFLEE